MARDAEILNKGVLQRMADFLQLGGVKRGPGFINNDDVKCVYVLGAEGASVASPNAEGVSRIDETGNYALAGESDFLVNVIANEAGIFSSNVGRRVDAMTFRLELDAAGTTAMNGKPVVMEWGYNFDGGDPGLTCPIGQIRFQIQASSTGGQLVYQIPIHASSQQNVGGVVFNEASTWNGRIPANTTFYVKIYSSDGTNFPANTEWNTYFCWRWSENTTPPRA